MGIARLETIRWEAGNSPWLTIGHDANEEDRSWLTVAVLETDWFDKDG